MIHLYLLSINDNVCFRIVYKEITFVYTVISQENYSDVIDVCFLFIILRNKHGRFYFLVFLSIY